MSEGRSPHSLFISPLRFTSQVGKIIARGDHVSFIKNLKPSFVTVFIGHMSLAKWNATAFVISLCLWEVKGYGDSLKRLASMDARVDIVFRLVFATHFLALIYLQRYGGFWWATLQHFAYDLFLFCVTCLEPKMLPLNGWRSNSRDKPLGLALLR